jgi:hypothetical protein
MPVPWFAKSDHSEPCTSSANEDAFVLLYDAMVVCKQALTVQRRRLQQARLKSCYACMYQMSLCHILKELNSESYVD